MLAGVAGFGYAAPIFGITNAVWAIPTPVKFGTSLMMIYPQDTDPNPNPAWAVLVYTLMFSVFLTLVSRISDIFGRRWFSVRRSAANLQDISLTKCSWR